MPLPHCVFMETDRKTEILAHHHAAHLRHSAEPTAHLLHRSFLLFIVFFGRLLQSYHIRKHLSRDFFGFFSKKEFYPLCAKGKSPGNTPEMCVRFLPFWERKTGKKKSGFLVANRSSFPIHMHSGSERADCSSKRLPFHDVFRAISYRQLDSGKRV